MGATYTLNATDQGVVRSVKAINAAFSETEKEAEKAAKATQRLEQSAQKIKEAIDPQTKLNRLYRELGEHVKAGRLTMEQATSAGVKYRQELGLAASEGKKAFGPAAASDIRAIGQEIAGITGIIGFAIQGFREFDAERKKAAQNALQSRVGLGSLSQLAATSKDPTAAFARLVAEARGFVATGAAADENEGGALLFQLKSAGLNKRDRAFAAQVKAAGTLQNVGGAAAAFDALTTALGPKEVGNFRQFLGKALIAAGPAPGSFEQLPIAAARAGGSAKFLGVNDEFLLAATTILGKQLGSIDEGGTQIAALLRQVEKSGLKGIQGAGGFGILDQLTALPAAKQGFGGVLGDRAEAVSALRTLKENRPALTSLYASIIAGQGADAAGVAAGLPTTDPQITAAAGRVRAEGKRSVQAGELFSRGENLYSAAIADIAARRRRDSPGRVTEIQNVMETLNSYVPFFNNPTANLSRFINQGEAISDPQLAKDIRDYLGLIEGNQRSKITTRQE